MSITPQLQYHLSGAIAAFFFILCLLGLHAQLKLIWSRRGGSAGTATAQLSLNQFTSSFLAFFSFFVYGFSVEKFNHYLVWPRLAATLLVVVILFEFARDRKDWQSKLSFFLSFISTTLALIYLLLGTGGSALGQQFSIALILLATLILAQGVSHQVYVLRRDQASGAVSIRYHQYVFLKDLSGFIFGLTMGLSVGWPVMLLHGVNAMARLGIFWQFYQISRRSPSL